MTPATSAAIPSSMTIPTFGPDTTGPLSRLPPVFTRLHDGMVATLETPEVWDTFPGVHHDGSRVLKTTDGQLEFICLPGETPKFWSRLLGRKATAGRWFMRTTGITVPQEDQHWCHEVCEMIWDRARESRRIRAEQRALADLETTASGLLKTAQAAVGN